MPPTGDDENNARCPSGLPQAMHNRSVLLSESEWQRETGNPRAARREFSLHTTALSTNIICCNIIPGIKQCRGGWPSLDTLAVRRRGCLPSETGPWQSLRHESGTLCLCPSTTCSASIQATAKDWTLLMELSWRSSSCTWLLELIAWLLSWHCNVVL